MRTRVRAVVIVSGLSGWIFCSAPARAEGTWVVIPGRPDVPVIVNPYGFDASYTVVEGDFGLDRPAQVDPRIVAGYLGVPVQRPRRYFFPHSDQQPGYGRYEIQPPPNRRLPRPAQSFHRFWGTASDPIPASTDPPYPIAIQPIVGPWAPGKSGGPGKSAAPGALGGPGGGKGGRQQGP